MQVEHQTAFHHPFLPVVVFYVFARGSTAHTGYQEYSKQANQPCSLGSSPDDGQPSPAAAVLEGHPTRRLPVTPVGCCQSQRRSWCFSSGWQPETWGGGDAPQDRAPQGHCKAQESRPSTRLSGHGLRGHCCDRLLRLH